MSNQIQARVVARKAATATANVSVVKKVSTAGRRVEVPVKDRNETALIDGLPANPAHVSVGMKATRNLGDFNSASVSVQITMPCATDDESVDACYQRTKVLVESYLHAELDELESA